MVGLQEEDLVGPLVQGWEDLVGHLVQGWEDLVQDLGLLVRDKEVAEEGLLFKGGLLVEVVL